MAQPSKSLDLESGSTQAFYTADNDNLRSDFTIEFWVNFETAPSALLQNILDKWNGTGNQREWAMFWHTDGNFYGQTSSTGVDTNTKTYTLETINTATWYHYAMVFDISAGELKVYRAIEGGSHALVGTLSAMETSIYNSTTRFDWFSANGTSGTLDGMLHDFRIWSDIRTVTELDDNSENAAMSDSETGLVMRLRFEDDLTDSSPSADNATAVGAPVYSTTVPTWASGDITPLTQSITASIPAYIVQTNSSTTINTQVATLSIPTYTIDTSGNKIVTPSTKAATFSIPAYSINAGGDTTVVPSTQTAVFSAEGYVVSVNSSSPINTLSAAFTAPSRTIFVSYPTTVVLGTQSLIFSLPTLKKVGAIWSRISRSTDSTWARKSRNSN